MPTYAELGREPAWGAEFAPPNLERFYQLLRAHYNLGPAVIGGKGDYRHLSGYHRSRRWILESKYASNRTYSVTKTLDKGGDANWLAALDASIPKPELFAVCRRVDAAVRAGELPQVAQWFGTYDAKTVVGWSYGKPGTSDSSHLFHLHISFYRSRANDDHTHLYEVITGGASMSTIDLSKWTLPAGAFYGDKAGPANSRGGGQVGDQNAIEHIQTALWIRGLFTGPTTGLFQASTIEAVKAWQAKTGRPVTGRVEKGDWQALFAPDPTPAPEPAGDFAARFDALPGQVAAAVWAAAPQPAEVELGEVDDDGLAETVAAKVDARLAARLARAGE